MTYTSPNGREQISEKADLWMRMYRQMMAIRLFEAQVNELYTRALMPGLGPPLHRRRGGCRGRV